MRGYGEHYFSLFVVAFGIVAVGSIYIRYLQDYIYGAFSFCAADILLLCWLPFYRCIIIVPCILSYILFLNHYDFNINRAIRYRDMRRVWKEQILKNSFYMMVLSFLITAGIVLIHLGSVEEWVNFDDRSSLFAFMNDGQMITDPPFIKIILVFWCCMFIYIELHTIFFQFLWWVTNNRMITFLIVFIWSTAESYTMKISLVFNRIGVGYDRWIHKDFGIGGTILTILIIAAVGIKAADRKEVLNAEKQ